MATQSISGAGLGLRSQHFHTILTENPPIPWFEVLSENYFGRGGSPLYHLDKIRENYPVVMHGVSLSIGSVDPLNLAYLKKLKHLANRIQPAWISDHLCWSSYGGYYFPDLYPLPYTEDTIQHVVRRVKQVQDYLGQRILLENVSSYLTYQHSELAEWEFLTEIATRADCFILLDINNVYVSSFNHHWDFDLYLEGIPVERVKQIHLAGYQDRGSYLLDNHGSQVHEPVWRLYQRAIQRFGSVPTLIEWDSNIPDFWTLKQEADLATRILYPETFHDTTNPLNTGSSRSEEFYLRDHSTELV
jgi:uncharacterized protein (UPF0276 family)